MIKLFDLQLFNEPTPEPAPEPTPTPDPTPTPSPELKYTDDDVDKMINKKFAEWQKKQEKKTSEAERLAAMSAEEKSNERIQAMEKRLAEYEKSALRADMTKQARTMLSDKGIHVPDELLSNLITDDAETTKAAVEAFTNLFNKAVEAAVKEKVKADPPKTGGGGTGLTKEQILKVQNRAERQRLIKENIELFS